MTSDKAVFISNVKHVNHQLQALIALDLSVDFFGLRLFSPDTIRKIGRMPALRLFHNLLSKRSGEWPDNVRFHGLGIGTYSSVIQGRLRINENRKLMHFHDQLQRGQIARSTRVIESARLVHTMESIGSKIIESRRSEQRIVLERRSLHPKDMAMPLKLLQGYPASALGISASTESMDEEFDGADAIVVYSEGARQSCVSNGVRPEKLFVVPIPYQNRFHPRLKQPDSKSSRFVFLGACHAHKGIDVAVDAVKSLGFGARLRVIGSATKDVRRWLDSHQHVDYLGVQDLGAIQREFDSATGLLMPSRESFGLAILEAISANVPVLIGADSGISSKLGRFAPECIVSNRDSTLWRDRVSWLASLTAPQRNELAIKSQRVLDCFDFWTSVEAQRKVYEAIL